MHFAPGVNMSRLAELAGGGDEAAAAEIRERLCPIVRVALRRGEGLPSVVRWVRRIYETMSGGRDGPPDEYTPAIAQMLCRELLRGRSTDPRAGDTVLGL